MVKRARERSDVVGAVRRIGDERLLQEHLEPRRDRRIDLAGAGHSRAHRVTGEHLVEHGAQREDARLGVTGGERGLKLGGDAAAIARVSREDRELRRDLGEPVGAGRDARGVDVDPLLSAVALLQVEAEGDERRYRLGQGEAAPFCTARIEERAQRRRGGGDGRLRSGADGRCGHGLLL